MYMYLEFSHGCFLFSLRVLLAATGFENALALLFTLLVLEPQGEYSDHE